MTTPSISPPGTRGSREGTHRSPPAPQRPAWTPRQPEGPSLLGSPCSHTGPALISELQIDLLAWVCSRPQRSPLDSTSSSLPCCEEHGWGTSPQSCVGCTDPPALRERVESPDKPGTQGHTRWGWGGADVEKSHSLLLRLLNLVINRTARHSVPSSSPKEPQEPLL